MEFKRWRGWCLCSLEGAQFPPDAQTADAPFSPLVFLIRRDPLKSRGWFAISQISELYEPEDISLLLPPQGHPAPEKLRSFVQEHGACVLNTAFSRAFDLLQSKKKKSSLRLTLVGLGDVGGTLLTALKLLGSELSEIGIFDPNEALCARYEMELNQVLSLDGAPLPKVRICPKEQFFDCDLLLFTASLGVPPVGSTVEDVRMAQFARNREMLLSYARAARASKFMGLFCQISDPVDQLSRVVFLESNRDEAGNFDGGGLLPEQIQGFGLGVMAARASYWAEKESVDFSQGRVYGPHGKELIVANHPTEYDDALSERLTALTVRANWKVRELGFKPYIAPALSSAAVSILRLIRGQEHYGAVPIGGAYFGCQNRLTDLGLSICREALHPDLWERIQKVHRSLEEFSYD